MENLIKSDDSCTFGAKLAHIYAWHFMGENLATAQYKHIKYSNIGIKSILAEGFE